MAVTTEYIVRVKGGRWVCEVVAVTVTKTLAVMAASVVGVVRLVVVADVGVKLGEVGACRCSRSAGGFTAEVVVAATGVVAVVTGTGAAIGV
jgi:hypothetical protein